MNLLVIDSKWFGRDKMRLHKGILEKLESKCYIERKKRGRNNLVKITEAGRFVAYFSGEL